MLADIMPQLSLSLWQAGRPGRDMAARQPISKPTQPYAKDAPRPDCPILAEQGKLDSPLGGRRSCKHGCKRAIQRNSEAHLNDAPFLMQKQCQNSRRDKHKHHPEGILLLIIRESDAPMIPHQVDDGEG